MVLGKFFRMETVVLVLAYIMIPTVSMRRTRIWVDQRV